MTVDTIQAAPDLTDDQIDAEIARLIAIRRRRDAKKPISDFEAQYGTLIEESWTVELMQRDIQPKLQEVLAAFNQDKSIKLQTNPTAQTREEYIIPTPPPEQKAKKQRSKSPKPKKPKKPEFAVLAPMLLKAGYGPKLRLRPSKKAAHVSATITEDGKVMYGDVPFNTPKAWMEEIYGIAVRLGKRDNIQAGPSLVIEIDHNGKWPKLYMAEDAVVGQAPDVPAIEQVQPAAPAQPTAPAVEQVQPA